MGTLSGSVPHDEDVVTPPVELSDTEHGMPLRLRAGSVGAADEFAPGVGGPPDGPIEPGTPAGLPVCAWACAVSPRIIVKTNRRFTGTLHCHHALPRGDAFRLNLADPLLFPELSAGSELLANTAGERSRTLPP